MKFKRIFEQTYKYKFLRDYTKKDIISLLPKKLLDYLSSKIGIDNIKLEVPSNNVISISFSKNNIPIEYRYFKGIKRWKDHSDKNEYRYLLSIETNILNDKKNIPEKVKNSEKKIDKYENIKDPRDMNIYEIAKIIKYKQNIDRQSSYSYYVKFMTLKPKVDAKEWFRIYDKV